jgi:hypothetical protein
MIPFMINVGKCIFDKSGYLARGYANTRYLESNSHPETDKVLTASYN